MALHFVQAAFIAGIVVLNVASYLRRRGLSAKEREAENKAIRESTNEGW